MLDMEEPLVNADEATVSSVANELGELLFLQSPYDKRLISLVNYPVTDKLRWSSQEGLKGARSGLLKQRALLFRAASTVSVLTYISHISIYSSPEFPRRGHHLWRKYLRHRESSRATLGRR